MRSSTEAALVGAGHSRRLPARFTGRTCAGSLGSSARPSVDRNRSWRLQMTRVRRDASTRRSVGGADERQRAMLRTTCASGAPILLEPRRRVITYLSRGL